MDARTRMLLTLQTYFLYTGNMSMLVAGGATGNINAQQEATLEKGGRIHETIVYAAIHKLNPASPNSTVDMIGRLIVTNK